MTDFSEVRRVVARFFQVSEAEVTEAYVFPPQRVQGSLGRSVFHAAIKRMAKVDLPAAFTAATYGELVRGGGTPVAAGATPGRAATPAEPPVLAAMGSGVQGLPLRVGVDLAALAELPAEASLEWAAFRKENFAAAELAYAAGRPEPRVTLLGLWAAKEAVLKCGWAGRLRPRDVTITHGSAGEPTVVLPGAEAGGASLALSVSHAGEFALAVCVRVGG